MSETIIAQRITVMLLGSGLAAVHMVQVRDTELGDYWDVQQTGIGRYKARDRNRAVGEAYSWSKSDEIPLDPMIAQEYQITVEKVNGTSK